MLFLRLLWLLLCVVAVMLVPRLLLCFHLVWIEFDVRCGVRARTRQTEKECMWIYHVHIFDIEYVNWLNTFMIWIYICNKICSLWTDCIESNLRFIPFIMVFLIHSMYLCVCVLLYFSCRWNGTFQSQKVPKKKLHQDWNLLRSNQNIRWRITYTFLLFCFYEFTWRS